MSECHKLVCISHPRIKSDREDCKRTLPEQNMQCSWPMERKKRGRSGGPFIKVTFLGRESNKELSGRFHFDGGRERRERFSRRSKHEKSLRHWLLSGADFSFSPTLRSRSNGGGGRAKWCEERRGEERGGLSYQFLLPSITFNGDVSVSERTGRKEERRERGRLDMCEKEIRRRWWKDFPFQLERNSFRSIKLVNLR